MKKKDGKWMDDVDGDWLEFDTPEDMFKYMTEEAKKRPPVKRRPEYGTNTDRSPGFHISLHTWDFSFWLLGLQVDICFHPRDWWLGIDDFGFLGLGPVTFNWSDSDL